MAIGDSFYEQGSLVLRVLRKKDAEHDEQDCDDDLDAVAENTLQRCARNDKGLHALDISNTVFAPRFYAQLGDAVRHNTALQELYLDNCCIDDEVLRVLARGIEQSPARAMRALSLEDNQIRCVGAGHLARILCASGSRWSRTFGGYRAPACGPGKGLQYLSLKGNAISAVGAKALAEALMVNDDSLERLSLEANKINDWGAGWFAMAMRNHNVLQCLDLHRNPISSDGIEELRSACMTAKASLVLLRPGSAAVQHAKSDSASTASLPTAPTSAMASPKSAGESEAAGTEETAAEDEELVALVVGQRLATVYVSEVQDGPGAQLGSASRPGSAFRRPGSASRREPMSTQRQNRALGIEEPGCARMADSAASGGLIDSAEAGCPPPPAATSTKFSVACLAYSGQRRAAVPAVSTYAASAGAQTYAGDQRPRSLRTRPGERSVGADEKETATVLVPPSRWRRKLREPSAMPGTDATSAGGAVAAARGLRRAWSAPGRQSSTGRGTGRRGAASACGTAKAPRCTNRYIRSACGRSSLRQNGMLLGPTAAAGAYGMTRGLAPV